MDGKNAEVVSVGKRKGLSMAGGLRIESLADLPERMRAQAAGKILAQGTAVAAEKAADAAGPGHPVSGGFYL